MSRPDQLIVIVVFVPVTHARIVRTALAGAGAGRIGLYSDCSFTTPGQGRFRPRQGSDPHIGRTGRLEVVDEVRIECVVSRSRARDVLTAMLAAHPYEEPAYHCYEALTIEDL